MSGDIDFMCRLRVLREERGWTQNEASRQTHIPLTTYRSYEDARCEPSLSNIRALCRTYDVEADWLCGLEEEVWR